MPLPWSRPSDSNRRPAVYETAALPTELGRQTGAAPPGSGIEYSTLRNSGAKGRLPECGERGDGCRGVNVPARSVPLHGWRMSGLPTPPTVVVSARRRGAIRGHREDEATPRRPEALGGDPAERRNCKRRRTTARSMTAGPGPATIRQVPLTIESICSIAACRGNGRDKKHPPTPALCDSRWRWRRQCRLGLGNESIDESGEIGQDQVRQDGSRRNIFPCRDAGENEHR